MRTRMRVNGGLARSAAFRARSLPAWAGPGWAALAPHGATLAMYREDASFSGVTVMSGIIEGRPAGPGTAVRARSAQVR